MSTVEIIDQLRALPASERRDAVDKIWAEFADHDLALRHAQAIELDHRLAEHEARPDDVIGWTEIKAATEIKYRQGS